MGRTSSTVLGVDPGTLVTGYGLILREGARVRVLEYGTVENRSTLPLPERLKAIYDRLIAVIDRRHPDECAVESAFYGKNVQSALKLGHARGVAILAAVSNGLPVAEYSPREVKKAVVGHGNASKEQVQGMVTSLLRLRATPRLFDATDALAVALCHLQRTEGVAGRWNQPGGKRYADWQAFLAAHPERIARTR